MELMKRMRKREQQLLREEEQRKLDRLSAIHDSLRDFSQPCGKLTRVDKVISLRMLVQLHRTSGLGADTTLQEDQSDNKREDNNDGRSVVDQKNSPRWSHSTRSLDGEQLVEGKGQASRTVDHKTPVHSTGRLPTNQHPPVVTRCSRLNRKLSRSASPRIRSNTGTNFTPSGTSQTHEPRLPSSRATCGISKSCGSMERRCTASRFEWGFYESSDPDSKESPSAGKKSRTPRPSSRRGRSRSKKDRAESEAKITLSLINFSRIRSHLMRMTIVVLALNIVVLISSVMRLRFILINYDADTTAEAAYMAYYYPGKYSWWADIRLSCLLVINATMVMLTHGIKVQGNYNAPAPTSAPAAIIQEV